MSNVSIKLLREGAKLPTRSSLIETLDMGKILLFFACETL